MLKLLSPMSTLRYHIEHIILRCSRKEMFWANANRIIAAMHNKSVWKNRPLSESISQSMNQHRTCTCRPSRNLTISHIISCTLPFPTSRFHLFDSRPKTIGQGLSGSSQYHASFRAVASLPLAYSYRPNLRDKFLLALLAKPLHKEIIPFRST